MHTAHPLRTVITVTLLLSLSAAPVRSQEKAPLRLAQRGQTSYRIVIAANAELRRRVRVARMSLQYAILSYCDADDPLRKKALDAFFPFARRIGMEQALDPRSDKLVALGAVEELAKKGPLMKR